MKKITTLMIVVCSVFIPIIGQEYEIISLDPEYLVPGQRNEITAVVNKNIEEGDSILGAGLWLWYNDGVNDDIQIHSNTCERTDSIFQISMDIPAGQYDEIGVFYLRVQDSYDSIVYNGPLFIGDYVNSVQAEICLVSAAKENRNVIIWENPQEATIDSVYIYKETSVSNEYEKIGAKGTEDLSEFVDNESIQAQNSNRYSISFVDTSGTESSMSNPHKTIHLTSNVGLNWSVNLLWNKYEGFNYSTFYIYRGLNSKQDMAKVAEIAGNSFSWTDLHPPLGHLYYQIAVFKPGGCTSISLKSTDATYASSVSNITESENITSVDLEEIENAVSIYPNPVNDKMFISSANEMLISSLTITDMMGRIIQTHHEVNIEPGIDISELCSGSYLVQIKTPEKIISRIIIKQ